MPGRDRSGVDGDFSCPSLGNSHVRPWGDQVTVPGESSWPPMGSFAWPLSTSRAIHFSAGEVFRHGWGEPGMGLVTDKPEFRDHLSEFALDQLWRLFFQTVSASLPLLERAGVHSEALDDDAVIQVLKPLLELGRVPLVHAAEWNLTPEGPLKLPTGEAP